ncbi:hypothetical protein K491DRAFT_683498 [Lophiostoma macrostomum CBS 122681]|uniref:F-box domain-containing protein n=1 Tax=Lophiostoma macrostomum CBS 122681 TaxID=1314788 RepID=A0A6A6SPU2_9PLEO|nr:hypothetical protein K491DRAFT_683498 [Lophiostoma macrostomum CBS 122681]
MARFDGLPAELKLAILEELYHLSSEKEFSRLLRVCKQWNTLATPLLWTYVPINNDNLIPFLKSLYSARQTTCDLTKSLSVQIRPTPARKSHFRDLNSSAKIHGTLAKDLITEIHNPLKNTYTRCIRTPSFFTTKAMKYIQIREDASDISEWSLVQSALWELWAIIENRFFSLEAFSFRVAAQSDPAIPVYNRRQRLTLTNRLLRNIFHVLPPSCISIELDDAHMTQKDPSHRFRNSLRAALPRLHHLQLSTGILCPSIMNDGYVNNMVQEGRSFSELRTLHIHLRPHGLAVCKCDLFKDGRVNPTVRLQNRRQNCLSSELRKAVDAGIFPKIESLRVNNFSGYLPPLWPGYPHYSQIDILGKTIDTFPTTPLLVFAEPTVEVWKRLDFNNNTYCELAATFPGGDLIPSAGVDKARGIGAIIIDDTWLTTERGIRLPLSRLYTKKCEQLGFVIMDPMDRIGHDCGLSNHVDGLPQQWRDIASQEDKPCLFLLRIMKPLTIRGYEEPIGLYDGYHPG